MTAVVLTAAALTMSMGMTALAVTTTIEGSNRSTKTQVTGYYDEGNGGGTVYKVDVEWEGMTFTYSANSSGTWNPNTHDFEGASESGWSSNTNGIKITNHSNAPITAKLSFQPTSGYPDITASWGTDGTESGEYTLASAAEGNSFKSPDNAPFVETAMQLAGDPGTISSHYIGDVIVTLVTE